MLLVSFAYSYETIVYFSKADTAFYCEESSAESSEESSEKSESFTDDDFLSNKHLFHRLVADPIELSALSAHQHTIFSSSDYSHEVYSPPEIL
jgi:hypothetical protein